ncbi:hypothetical protein Entas_3231 [Enterobacter soli]|uniref:hypothetical protein n=1 Tax=Enterobacter soli TaxID=885040 RepID=UPI000223D544|nr:hypothetical protein [Enterobacter soli]AEN65953.1 hypothetical protein Entas_3231 [Enterobacter soli]OAT35291.1 hypothetical protein M987_04425 [Enterobacter soli ATCC BAA-2102]
MSRPAKWSIRVLGILAMTFMLMLSGIFDPLAESLKFTVTDLLNYIPYEKGPYADRVEDNYFTLYIICNALASVMTVFIGEIVVKLSRIEC